MLSIRRGQKKKKERATHQLIKITRIISNIIMTTPNKIVVKYFGITYCQELFSSFDSFEIHYSAGQQF
jgi:hypothetical protein